MQTIGRKVFLKYFGQWFTPKSPSVFGLESVIKIFQEKFIGKNPHVVKTQPQHHSPNAKNINYMIIHL